MGIACTATDTTITGLGFFACVAAAMITAPATAARVSAIGIPMFLGG